MIDMEIAAALARDDAEMDDIHEIHASLTAWIEELADAVRQLGPSNQTRALLTLSQYPDCVGIGLEFFALNGDLFGIEINANGGLSFQSQRAEVRNVGAGGAVAAALLAELGMSAILQAGV